LDGFLSGCRSVASALSNHGLANELSVEDLNHVLWCSGDSNVIMRWGGWQLISEESKRTKSANGEGDVVAKRKDGQLEAFR